MIKFIYLFQFYFNIDEKAFGQDGYGAKASAVLMQVNITFFL